MYIQQTEFTEQLKKLKIDYIRYRIINVNSTSDILSTCNNTSSQKIFKVTKDHLCKKESIFIYRVYVIFMPNSSTIFTEQNKCLINKK